MGPGKDSSAPHQNQEARKIAGTKGCRRRARCPRSRLCLLKGCGQVFRPHQPLVRYCSEACREQARRWRQWKAPAISSIAERQAKAASSEPPLPGAPQGTASIRRPHRPEGHPCQIFFRVPATARVATAGLAGVGGHRCRGFVPWPVAALWSEFLSGRDAGANGYGSRKGE
jgi:hypothetical protein